jgi:hypothetical protein
VGQGYLVTQGLAQFSGKSEPTTLIAFFKASLFPAIPNGQGFTLPVSLLGLVLRIESDCGIGDYHEMALPG